MLLFFMILGIGCLLLVRVSSLVILDVPDFLLWNRHSISCVSAGSLGAPNQLLSLGHRPLPEVPRGVERAKPAPKLTEVIPCSRQNKTEHAIAT